MKYVIYLFSFLYVQDYVLKYARFSFAYIFVCKIILGSISRKYLRYLDYKYNFEAKLL